jgi:hypothetical protein
MGRDYKALRGDAQLYVVAQSTLLDQQLGDANSLGIADPCKLDPH